MPMTSSPIRNHNARDRECLSISAKSLAFLLPAGNSGAQICGFSYPNVLCGQFYDDLSSVASLRKMTGLRNLLFELGPSQRSEVGENDIFLPRLLCLASLLERLKMPILSELIVTYTNPILLFPEFPPVMDSLTEV